MKCNGQGADGAHCCYIGGQVCEFLDEATVRCTLWGEMGSPEWEFAPVGRWFAVTHPGFTCHDWPQNIPSVMAKAETTGPFGLCCWGRGNNGDVG